MPRRSTAPSEHDPLLRRLDDIVGSDPNRHVLGQAAAHLRDHGELLRRLLTAVVLRDDAFSEVAPRSTLHPNGFAKIVLYGARNWILRLHVWSPRIPIRAEPDPHGHRWAFVSWVITGVLRETTFTPAANGLPFDECDFGDFGGEGNHPGGLIPVGRARLVETGTLDRLAGEVYIRSGAELHTATPVDGGLVASLVVRARSLRTTTSVFLTPGMSPERREQRLRDDLLRALLDDVVRAVP